MAETNSTLAQYPRSSTTPELWIPYIMIGVSCVTFLAVHFWCYHKRNRQRYLRKRDEKRVKSGLMERRRITTLMLARYQSDLGVSHSETDLHLSQDVLFYENTTDVCFDEQDINRDSATKRRHSFQQAVVMAENNTPDPTKVPLPEVSVTTEPQTLEPSEPQDSQTSTAKTVSTSQTWPRVSQSKTKPYNAHEISPNTNTEHDPYSTAITEQEQPHFDNTSRYLKHNEHPQGSHQTSPFDPTIQVIPENRSNFGTIYSNFHSTPPPAYQTCIPPVTYPNVFYTSLTSPYNTKSPLGISSKSKHKKRRYDGKLVQDSELSDESHGQPGPSTSNDLEEEETIITSDAVGETSHLYAISNRGDDPNMGYVYPNSDQYFCPVVTAEETNYVRKREEAFPFAGPGQAYGSIRSHSVRENQEMIPLQEIRRDHTQSVLGAGQEQTQASGSGVSHHQHGDERPMFVLPYVAAGKSNSDITAVEMELKSQPHPAMHNYRNVIIAMPERSRHNFVSRTPGKVRAAGGGAGPSAGKLPPTTMLKPSHIARMDTFDYSSSDQEGDSIASDMSNPETIPEGLPQKPQKSSQKPGYIQSNTQGITAHDIPAHRGLQNQSVSEAENIKDKSNVAKDATQDGSPETVQTEDEDDFSKPKLQTPSLRSLDPHLVFHHSKRKMTTKANEDK